MQSSFLNLTRTILHVLYYLVSNQNTVITYENFIQLSPTFDLNNNVRVMIHRMRHLLRQNGYLIISHRKIGYECVKIQDKEIENVS